MNVGNLFLSPLLSVLLFFPLSAQERRTIHVEYLKSECHYCKMLFQEKQFGAELQTTDDSLFEFDATECLAAFLITKLVPENKIRKIWSVDYAKPSTLTDAKSAIYIRSDKILSPMSVNLAAFGSPAEADSVQAIIGGTRMNWNEALQLVRDRWYPGSNPK